jgi:hypothetical protein
VVPIGSRSAPGSNRRETDDALFQRVRDDLVDRFDEELERDDQALAAGPPGFAHAEGAVKMVRRRYFRELFRLRRERVNMRDWTGCQATT